MIAQVIAQESDVPVPSRPEAAATGAGLGTPCEHIMHRQHTMSMIKQSLVSIRGLRLFQRTHNSAANLGIACQDVFLYSRQISGPRVVYDLRYAASLTLKRLYP
jgi:hypothetical protein